MEEKKMFDSISYRIDKRIEKLEYLVKSDNVKIIYGAGKAALLRYAWLKEYNIEVDCFCVDSDFYKENWEIDKKPVLKIEEVLSCNKNIDLIIGFENTVKARNAENTINGSIKVIWIEDPFRFRDFDYNYFLKHYADYYDAFCLLEDDESKQIFVDALNSRICGESSVMQKHQSKCGYSYDYDLLQIGVQESFVDCGAYDGDTIEEFLSYTQGKCEAIWAFEPDDENADKLERKFQECRKTIIRKCVGDKEDIVRFYSDSSLYSNVVDSGMWGDETRRDLYGDKDQYVEVKMCKIDDELVEQNISLIKMDIEGSELKALIGARNTINRCFPKLAICIYHKGEDFHTLISEIHKHDTTERYYKYYLRHHSDDISETVLYAIPFYES